MGYELKLKAVRSEWLVLARRDGDADWIGVAVLPNLDRAKTVHDFLRENPDILALVYDHCATRGP